MSTSVNQTFRIPMPFMIAATVWVAHYWNVSSFGLYEDDFIFIGQAITSTGLENWYKVKYHLLQFWQGRPIHISLVTFLSYWGAKIGGLPILYAIGYGIVTANAILFYALLRRLSDDAAFAISGALAFALFPADTTHVYLTHAYALRTSLLFLLAACYAFMSRRPLIAYGLSICCLLTYETPFTVFLVAPLLLRESGSERLRRLVKHGVIVAIILSCYIVLRKAFGEHLIGTIEFPAALVRPFRQMLVGPLTSMAMFLYRPFETLIKLNSESIIAYVLFATAFWGILSQVKSNFSENSSLCREGSQKGLSFTWVSDLFRPYANLALTGLAMLIFAYPLTFTVPAEAIDGRASRVHLAAMPGASILCGCACSAILAFGHKYGVQRLAKALLTAFFVLLLGFGLVIQTDYAQSWKYQQSFWRQVVYLCPDMNERTVILMELETLPHYTHIKPFSWSAPYVLEQIYQFPEAWEHNPKFYWLQKGWQSHIISDGKFELNDDVVPFFLWWEPLRVVDSADVIMLEWENGRIKRQTQSPQINGHAYVLKDRALSNASPPAKNILYKYLISSGTAQMKDAK